MAQNREPYRQDKSNHRSHQGKDCARKSLPHDQNGHHQGLVGRWIQS
ncbi:MAG: hypothetical protein HOK56_04315 [Deltaproteobacteria bacterium]|nr:hypothetical protein [Deltaproteobacteria bacterium]